ncbi:small VCP interacting protein [Tachypleus tridentatus]|uniref:small VCP interacting protein n=1 Tax=Tachypleus tridentatus TaxID=6853 RepID=UPI003FD5AD56
MATAAEQRKKEAETRGIKDLEKVKRQQQRQEVIDSAMEQKGREEGKLQDTIEKIKGYYRVFGKSLCSL